MKKNFLAKLELDRDIIIERAHRAKQSKYDKKHQLWTILWKLLNFKNKVEILWNRKKLKDSNINDDFCQDMPQYRKELWKDVKWLRRNEDKIADLQYPSIMVKDKISIC